MWIENMAEAPRARPQQKTLVRVTHIISGLSTGGAEMMLFKLLSVRDGQADHVEVVSLTDIGPVGAKIAKLGIPVKALEMRRGMPSITALVRLAKRLRDTRPRIVQTWMYHADLLGGLAARIVGNVPVVWGIRNGMLEPRGNRRTTIWTAKLCARVSARVPRRIAVNSEKARRFHEGMGYCATKMKVIPNGFDLTAFKPDAGMRRSVRQELGLSPDALLIGLIARFDPQKDHRNFFEAAHELIQKRPDAHFILCGDGVDSDNTVLASWIGEFGTKRQFHLLGRRDDVPRLTAALDIASCSSYAEAFPNVLGEAMACCVPCATTDAGDAVFIVGNTGIVVPAKNPRALADAWLRLVEMGCEGREQLGQSARQRVKEEFDINVIASRYKGLYEDIVSTSGSRSVRQQ
jgi:glycosyltransferase involved in cell wall biosynthesis